MTERQGSQTFNMRGQYDTVSKVRIHQNPEDWLRFSSGIPDAEVIEVLATEQPTVKSNRADSFIRANVEGKEVIVHLEMQTHDSSDVPMPYRMAGYMGRAIESFQLPIYSHVIYLHPRAGLTDPGEYIQEMSGYEIRIRYKVIRLCELEGLPFLEAGVKGLIPFAPLMKPPAGVSGEEWLRRCVEVADSIPQDKISKVDYLADLAILSGLIFDYSTIRKTIMEGTMHESSVIQHFLQRGLEQGKVEGLQQGLEQGLEQGRINEKRTDVLKIVRHRFAEKSDTVLNEITAINDLVHLDDLFDQVLTAETFEDIDFSKNGK